MLKNKKVVLFVTGGIAVYKAAELTRQFIKHGATVKVAMTASATEFVTPLTFQVLSKSDVYIDTFDEKVSSEVAHIHLADWADVAIVAPATANIIAKMANGIADDMVSTTLLAITAPVFVAPAMNVHMFEHPATIRNLTQLQQDGVHIIEPDTGFLAEGYEGKGRLPEPIKIVENMMATLIKKEKQLPLSGKNVLITAGGTKERIDPVRYLTNDSSGKMGYAMAMAARDLGANVTLISATQHQSEPFGIAIHYVESAEEMKNMVLSKYDTTDMAIMAAAVADYRPIQQADKKMKKTGHDLQLELAQTTDILKLLGQTKKQQYLIGFAAETNDLLTYGQQKLINKQADMIVANDVSKANAGFHSDTNEVTVLMPKETPIQLPNASKYEIAKEVLIIAASKI
ncbi:bifunctional phosphopantothenoylcysteine decarboxylase/phosphopantothenate--cysteine ligase CoaBC [Isobaculum melis]|uniref:Coenzyme A biosynthesis bifunctional protein CoaBC n=1 Tax=Isobaculum melis TaxID=142588 RepID=A0A1H9RBW8_9LACT|nr:bifunctional phosphopantothenoylcysteine decarboxylase/phosphopantothenate--cysteine ligase CoaBC [Isobaculum melis]SER69539.1 phosphopantothenoylcysteine decarboxylase / phosphopantothenate--cysteine ligase [Isobaculum melis]